MSSDEEEYVYSDYSDEGDYNSDDSIGSGGSGAADGGDGSKDVKIRLENLYWQAEDVIRSDPDRALGQFLEFLELDSSVASGSAEGMAAEHVEIEDVGIGRFHVLYHIVLIYFRLGNYEKMLEYHKSLLNFLPKVTRNERQKAVEDILKTIMSPQDNGDVAAETQNFLVKAYSITLEVLQDLKVDARLTFSIRKSLGNIYLQLGQIDMVTSVIGQLHASCVDESGKSDMNGKAEWMLETMALELQLCAKTKNFRRQKAIHKLTKQLSHAVVDPSTLAVIHEDCGRMYMREGLWTEAYNEFFNGFNRNSETANARAQVCLKYVVLANMLSLSDINPFDSREAKAYQDDPEIKTMMNLRRAYDAHESTLFEQILRESGIIESDPFLAKYLDPLLQQTRSAVVREFVRPYSRVKLESIAQELAVPEAEVEAILRKLILDGQLDAKIDQVKRVLVVYQSVDTARYAALQSWSESLGKILDTCQVRRY